MTNAQITNTYNQYKPLINKVCSNMSSYYGIDISELEWECNNIFWRTIDSFEPEKSKFITWLTNNLKGRLIRHCGYRANHDPLIYAEQFEEWHSLDVFEDNLTDILHSLSFESQQIIHIIFNPPEDLCDIISKKDKINSKGIYLENIKEYLRNKGWVLPAIQKCFKEIKQILKEI